jgi:uncharacterized protein YjbI with pentapeptide repeats
MEHAIIIGAAVGLLVAFGLGRAYQLEFTGTVLTSTLGAVIGILGGIRWALKWAVEAPSRPASSDVLFDPWLDSRHAERDSESKPTSPIENAVAARSGVVGQPRARVRPRVVAPETGESLLIEDVIGPIMAGRECGVIRLVGPPGSGKTAALDHLARVLPDHLRLNIFDYPCLLGVAVALSRGWVALTALDSSPTFPGLVTNLRLAPWREDEWIEYLLASAPQSCASVMGRLANAKDDAARFDGIPELWQVVLDHMADDPSISGPVGALESELGIWLSDPGYRQTIEAGCFDALVRPDDDRTGRRENLQWPDPAEGLFRLIRHRQVQLLLAADWIAASIKHRVEICTLAYALPRELVLATAATIANDSQAVERLRSLINPHDHSLHPMAASLLHVLRIGWKPDAPQPCLAGAFLDDASWPEIDLTRADGKGVDLSRANLARSRLDRANLEDANLGGANLRGSSMKGATFDKANLYQACLAHICAERAGFRSACLASTDLERAKLDRAKLVGADMTDARLSDSGLIGTDLRSTKIEGADFSRADLTEAILRGLKLASARFTGARFSRADLSKCDLEGMLLPGAIFTDANLREALLTGSRMPGANFQGACLRAAGLAGVEWEGADLRGADLREAAFHLGSSRNGLVGSPIACEGSRTGFYTDDFEEQTFKSPEEIRKADLRGVDLRGARIDHVDFYLVDLRDARLDPEQIPQIRRSGAILEARA